MTIRWSLPETPPRPREDESVTTAQSYVSDIANVAARGIAPG